MLDSRSPGGTDENFDKEADMRVLAIGAHPDDIELGCGATLLAHVARGHEVSMLVMTTGEQGPQMARSRTHEQEDAARLLRANLYWGNFEDGAVPEGRTAVGSIEAILRETQATVVYTHASRDTHQDHRATAVATLAAARRATSVLQYESPSTIGFTPTIFVDVEGFVEGKLALLRAHASQVQRNGLVDLEAIEAQARYRGFNARLRHAEGFVCERMQFDLGVHRMTPEQELLLLNGTN